ncbi:MAG: hypothetical protein WBO45_01610, partial [Planctomycetota bacterium]
MALREGPRRWLMRLAWSLFLVAGAMLIGLRSGRPLYYTDGARELPARELANAGMFTWGSPEVAAELPGPVAGRVTPLADGRLLYGRLGADGTADLVTWDPAHPRLQPEPVVGLNSAGNDLAATIVGDGRVLFASDREGGAGGYDLYVAPGLRAAVAEVAPIPATSTALDETDPALHGNGVDLVFVRSDRRIQGGNDGVLWRCRLGDALDPVPVFAEAPPRARPIDRDPVFTADGAALWFVRKPPGHRLSVWRSTVRNGEIEAGAPVGERWGRELRSPAPSASGTKLGLLAARAGEPASDLWYEASGREVYPWWPGQRWLELLLLGVVLGSALLLLLLHLGRRWSALDLIAQCLLLSMLLHLLLFLWLMGVEISQGVLPGSADDGGFEVAIVAAPARTSAG